MLYVYRSITRQMQLIQLHWLYAHELMVLKCIRQIVRLYKRYSCLFPTLPSSKVTPVINIFNAEPRTPLC